MPRKIDRQSRALITERFLTNQLWLGQHYSDHSEIMAYSKVSGKFESVLVVRSLSGYSAKTMAEYVLGVINETILSESLMLNAMQMMQSLLIENDFDLKIEQPVIDLIERIRRTYGMAQKQGKSL